MDAIEAAVRVIIDLLVRGRDGTVEKVTQGRRLTSGELGAAVSGYGRRLVEPGDTWWSAVIVTPIDAGDRASFHVAAPLWTEEEGRSDLTLELRLTECVPGAYETDVLDVHVL